MQALNSLGIDWKLLIAQIINFLILLFVLTKLLYKPIIKMFDQRKVKIDQGLKDAEAATESLQKAELEAEKIIGKAYQDSGEILTNAKKEAAIEASKISEQASHEAQNIIKNASGEALMIKNQALQEAKAQISDLISLSLSKIITTSLDESTKQKLTKDAIRDLKI